MFLSVFLLFYVYTSVLSFSLFFHSQLVKCILENFPYPLPRILFTISNVSIFCHCFIERFPITSVLEQADYSSLYYAFHKLKGCKFVPSGCTLIDMSGNGKLFLSSVVSNVNWKFRCWRLNVPLQDDLISMLRIQDDFISHKVVNLMFQIHSGMATEACWILPICNEIYIMCVRLKRKNSFSSLPEMFNENIWYS